jgi:Zn-dependent M32 family carboxypeptidase
MKDLFFERLPIGKDTKQIEEHFNRLEEAIANKENINPDEFPDYDTVDLDKAVQDPPQDFHYFSAAVLKQQADRGRIDTTRHPLETIEQPSTQSQDMDTTPDGQACDSASSDSEINGDLQPDWERVYRDPFGAPDGDC